MPYSVLEGNQGQRRLFKISLSDDGFAIHAINLPSTLQEMDVHQVTQAAVTPQTHVCNSKVTAHLKLLLIFPVEKGI